MTLSPPWPVALPEAAGPLAPDELRLWWCPSLTAGTTDSPRRQGPDALLLRLLAPTLRLPPDALRFGREAKGRPWLDHPEAPDFNLSDTDGGRLVAITGAARVGVDLERIDREPPVQRLADRWFAPIEAQALAKLPDAAARRAFLHLWTAKEASCKATGTGIYGQLQHWVFDAGDEQPRLLALPADAGAAERWSFLRVRPSGQHTAVLALRDAGRIAIRAATLPPD